MSPARRLVALTLALALALLVAGCARPLAPTPSPELSTATSVPEEEAIGKRMMDVGPRASLPRGFPLEVPVIAGAIETTSASTGEMSWVYTLSTQGPVESVARWYERAYVAASWKEAARAAAPGAKTATEVTFVKGGAESLIHIEDAGGGKAFVRASVGVGEPAPRAY